MKRSNMVLLDNLFLPAFWCGKKLKSIFPVRKSNQNHTVILKFFGVGSITRITSVLREPEANQKFTFLTLKRNQAAIELLGQEAIYINDRNAFVLLGSLFSRMFHVWKMRSTRIVDMERSSNIAGLYSIMLSIGKKYARFHLEEGNSVKRSMKSVSLNGKPATQAIAEILAIPLLQGVDDGRSKPVEVRNVVVNINAGAYLPERKYPKEKWVELIKGLNERFPNATYAFSGLKNEIEQVNALSDKLSEVIPTARRIVLAGSQNLQEFTDSLKQSDLFLTNDSGPLHLAHFYGVKTVTIWGPTSSYLVGYPDSNKMLNLSQDRSCSPCFVGPKSAVAKACEGRLTCFQEMDTSLMLKKIESFVS